MKGWIRISIVTTPIFMLLSFLLVSTEKYYINPNDHLRYFIYNWFLYGLGNFIFWILVGWLIIKGIPWIKEGFKGK